MAKMSHEDRMAYLDSEVFQELEKLTKAAQATLSDKIVQSPTAQQAIRDGITRALENKADDDDEHEDVRDGIKKLDDHMLFEFFKMFAEELKSRGIDAENYEEKFEEDEAEETEEDEEKEDEEMAEVVAYVKSALTNLAYKAADDSNTEAAYLIERCIQKISRG